MFCLIELPEQPSGYVNLSTAGLDPEMSPGGAPSGSAATTDLQSQTRSRRVEDEGRTDRFRRRQDERQQAALAGAVTRCRIIQSCYGLRVFAARIFDGAVSGIISMAQSPAAVATSMYQAGASAFPVTWVSQATMS